MKSSDVLIIGGGAAGLTAALSASSQGARVTVLEAASRVGRKILASGNGRCNLANMGPLRYPGNPELAAQVLSLCPVEEVLRFFHGLGLITAEEDQGRVYPACGQAAAVLDALRQAIDRQGVLVLCYESAARIEKAGRRFRVMAREHSLEADAVVLACGGMAGGKLGHDGGAYELLTRLGHTLVPPRAALSPLTADKSAVKGLAGLRLPAILTLCRRRGGLFDVPREDRDVPLCQSQGEALFTDYGVSGVCAMELARFARMEQEETGEWPLLYLDFSPMLGLTPRAFGFRDTPASPAKNTRAAQALLEERRHMLPQEDLLVGLAPRLLRERLQGQSIPRLARSLTAFPVPLTGIRGFEYAQVTAGGISAAEFDPATLTSRRVPGLYIAGEMLDVDGACGGFNLQFAFASGLIAGSAAANFARQNRG